jgi:hypothetical protein
MKLMDIMRLESNHYYTAHFLFSISSSLLSHALSTIFSIKHKSKKKKNQTQVHHFIQNQTKVLLLCHILFSALKLISSLELNNKRYVSILFLNQDFKIYWLCFLLLLNF